MRSPYNTQHTHVRGAMRGDAAEFQQMSVIIYAFFPNETAFVSSHARAALAEQMLLNPSFAWTS